MQINLPSWSCIRDGQEADAPTCRSLSWTLSEEDVFWLKLLVNFAVPHLSAMSQPMGFRTLATRMRNAWRKRMNVNLTGACGCEWPSQDDGCGCVHTKRVNSGVVLLGERGNLYFCNKVITNALPTGGVTTVTRPCPQLFVENKSQRINCIYCLYSNRLEQKLKEITKKTHWA